VPMVAVFDTAFHQTMPPKAYLYGLPYEYYEKYKVRRYGFHGTSHDFVSSEAAKFLGKDRKDLKIIVCHLGNGASISAVMNGKSVDTSMGLTPLEGLIMGTRSGDIDPAIITFLSNKLHVPADAVIDILNKKSGVYGLSKVSSDFRDLEKAYNEGNELAKITLETYSYRVAKYIGSYVAAMNGVDVIAYTAGVGENTSLVRKMVGEYLTYLGTNVDPEKNKIRGEIVVLSDPGSKVVTMIVPTNEELAICRETVRLVK
nr:acetate/propionate family kinase [Lachnospiraceae bacterium]